MDNKITFIDNKTLYQVFICFLGIGKLKDPKFNNRYLQALAADLTVDNLPNESKWYHSKYVTEFDEFEINVAYFEDFIKDDWYPYLKDAVKQYQKNLSCDPKIVGILVPMAGPIKHDLHLDCAVAHPNGILIHSAPIGL
jgi:hypothetical protein